MNWLAHLALAEPDPAFRLGCLLPDLLPITQWRDLPEPVLRGARCHREIDAYTDAHPVVRRSVARIDPPWRRFGGVLVDVFYDHVLARTWTRYSAQPFETFEDSVYRAIDEADGRIPAAAATRLATMRRHRWLRTYAKLDGIAMALERIGARMRRPQALGEGVVILAAHYDDFAADFAAFFPQLIGDLSTRYALTLTPPVGTYA